jgi:hypothetical protein
MKTALFVAGFFNKNRFYNDVMLPFCFIFKDLFFGGERGIRTLDTLPYTHFPGVRLRPLGHLS